MEPRISTCASSRNDKLVEPRRSLRNLHTSPRGGMRGSSHWSSSPYPTSAQKTPSRRRQQSRAARLTLSPCSLSGDCPPPSSAQHMVAGIVEAAAAMGMGSPLLLTKGVIEDSPSSVLQGVGGLLSGTFGSPFTPPPPPGLSLPSCTPLSMDEDMAERVDVAERPLRLDSAEGAKEEAEMAGAAMGDEAVAKISLDPLILRRRSMASDDSNPWSKRGQRSNSQCSSERSGDGAERRSWEAFSANCRAETEWDRSERPNSPSSPTTPNMGNSPVHMECPAAPQPRSKDLPRNSSLRDTKVLLTTHLKRSASVFTFDKQFEFLRELGRGSQSTVYEARDRRSGALCAIKMSKQRFSTREERERYMHELESVGSLTEHPNVVRYYRGWQQDAHLFIQMELCEGGSLRQLLDQEGRPLEEGLVWGMAGQLAAGLHHIHSNGVMHLDIKPDNIFLDMQGVVKIGDFGMAVLRHQWEWEEGDGAYVAPELLREEQPGPPADMYSSGAMLYEWVWGKQLPRSGPARKGDVEMPPTCSLPLKRLIHLLLNPKPELRPTAEMMLAWAKNPGSYKYRGTSE